MVRRMSADSRLGALIELLRRDGQAEVAEPADRFGTAEMTVRRDLEWGSSPRAPHGAFTAAPSAS